MLRQLRPRVVILPYWQARHPDHAIVGTLGYEACFLSGLKKVDTGAEPHRPFKIVYASLYADVRPSFIVDITPFVEQRHAALMAYRRSMRTSRPAADCLFPKKRFASARSPKRAIMACSPASAMANPLCRRKSAWSTT